MTHHSRAGYGLRGLLTVLLTTRVCVLLRNDDLEGLSGCV